MGEVAKVVSKVITMVSSDHKLSKCLNILLIMLG